jgi:hypothetical protein
VPAPERFEDLRPVLQERLHRAGDLTDPDWSRARGLRSLATASAALVLLFVPGGWLLSAPVAALATLRGALVLRRTWGFSRHSRGRALAWAGLAASLFVLVRVGAHLWSLRSALDSFDRLLSR